jgi:hypothetical protein
MIGPGVVLLKGLFNLLLRVYKWCQEYKSMYLSVWIFFCVTSFSGNRTMLPYAFGRDSAFRG